jgi:DNA-binding NarL/FixJ family response regulator
MIEARVPPVTSDSDPAASRTTGLRILIVDVHPPVRAAIRRSLAARDMEVVAETGSADDIDGLALEVQPDVVLLENDLDSAAGHGLVRRLAKLLPHTAIVLFALSFAETDVVDAMQAGAAGFLELGMGAQALQRAVRGAVHGDVAMSGAWARRVVRFLTSSNGHGRRPAVAAELTPRELEILQLLAGGLTAREAAAILGISNRTAEGHVGEILRRLGARNRAEAVRRLAERV